MNVNKLIIAPDSFKGTFTAEEIATILENRAKELFPGVIVDCLPVSDGGEGLLAAVEQARGGHSISLSVHDPLMRKTQAQALELDTDTILLEMAEASGLCKLSEAERNSLLATSYGTGEMIAWAIESGYREILLGIGGSATNDGGSGMLEALGVNFFYDCEPMRGGGALMHITSVDVSVLSKKLSGVQITAVCDVTNPLLGDTGATYVFGRQKGANDAMLAELERGMERYAEVIARDAYTELRGVTGGGAAGGVGATLIGVLGARFQSGIDTVLDMLNFDNRIAGADAVITGEGRIDSQSVDGKVLSGIGKRCVKAHIPALALCGILGYGYERIFEVGIADVFPAVAEFCDYDFMLENKEHFIRCAADRLLRSLKY